MIVVRAPFRVSFLGGGSDIPEFFTAHGGGAVLSTAIDRHMFLTGRHMFDASQTLVKYSQSELVGNVQDIRHPIFREALHYFDLEGLDIGVSSDIPAGTGLGSSSTFTVALVALLSEIKGQRLAKEEIADLACKIEIEILGEPIGKQDQFASAVGGFNLFLFKESGEVETESLNLSPNDYQKLNDSLFLVKLDEPARSASEMLRVASENLKMNSNAIAATKELSSLALEGFREISRRGIDVLPEYLNHAWELKKRANPGASMAVAFETVELGLRSGAKAAKLLGAGGGGFVLFIVDSKMQGRFSEAFSRNVVLRVGMDLSGVTVIYREVVKK